MTTQALAPSANPDELLAIAMSYVATLEGTLREWACPSCGGKRTYLNRSKTGSEVVPCKVCDQSGLHPLARAALQLCRPDQPRNDDVAKDRVALVERLIAEETDGFAPEAADAFARGVIAAFGHGQAVAWNRAAQRRTCRVCGCWELEACGSGCWWVDDDLCSSCETDGEEPA